MKKSIVITSIFPPTAAVRKFAAVADYDLIVVGDKKTPADWQHPGVTFLSLEEQLRELSPLAELIPLNSYPRKVLGYVQAIKHGAELLVDTDDDNIPYDDWAVPDFSGEYACLPKDLEMINIYQLYAQGEINIWPRGLPLHLITQDFALAEKLGKAPSRIGIWQGLADKSPDVDAIYRLTGDAEYTFAKRAPVVLGRGTISAYNSQNTATIKELFPLLYLPSTVTFRYTDILRGWVAQPIMWEHGYSLGFTAATVYQERNPHDYFDDFKLEIDVYLTSEKALEIARATATKQLSVADNLLKVYGELIKAGIVGEQEMAILEAWLRAIS